MNKYNQNQKVFLAEYSKNKVEVTYLSILGLVVIKPQVFADERGTFSETYNKKAFALHGITQEFVQDNQSRSGLNILRGLHFQAPPFAQAKLVRVTRGSVLDVAVDLRIGSPTYGQHESIVLSAENQLMFLITEGFAHGFLSLEAGSIFQYKCSALYDKASEGCLMWNDPTLNIKWGIENPIVSSKDLQGSTFSEFTSPFSV